MLDCLASSKVLSSFLSLLCIEARFWTASLLEELLWNQLEYVDPKLLPAPLLVQAECTLGLVEDTFDINLDLMTLELCLISRQLELSSKLRKLARVELYRKVRRVDMLSEQASLLSIDIHVVDRLKQLQRRWLVDIVNNDSKRSGFIEPVQCVNLFI